MKSVGYSARQTNIMSPSARKVWIEIIGVIEGYGWEKSPSARKVWIEIIADMIYKAMAG